MQTIRRWQLAIFFVLAFGLTWLVWGSKIAQNHALIAFHIPGTFAFIGLSVAALATAALAGGRGATGELLGRLVRWRVAPRWYLAAVGVPVALALVPVGIFRLAGGDVPVGQDMALGTALGYFVFGTFLFLLTEELAWRGFALPRLQARWSALAAALVLGVLWGLWHTPLFFIPGEAQAGWSLPAFVLLTIAESVLITWVYNSADESVLIAAIFHAASDAALSFSGVLAGGDGLFWLTVVVFWLVAGAVVLQAGPARLAHGGRSVASVAPAPTAPGRP
jgi:membrane protease YdiL (CAAX protease family)